MQLIAELLARVAGDRARHLADQVAAQAVVDILLADAMQHFGQKSARHGDIDAPFVRAGQADEAAIVQEARRPEFDDRLAQMRFLARDLLEIVDDDPDEEIEVAVRHDTAPFIDSGSSSFRQTMSDERCPSHSTGITNVATLFGKWMASGRPRSTTGTEMRKLRPRCSRALPEMVLAISPTKSAHMSSETSVSPSCCTSFWTIRRGAV